MSIGRDFFLRGLESELRALPAAQRLPLRRLFDLGQQKLTSARLLWASDQTAEALRLAIEALAVAGTAAKAAAALRGGPDGPDGSTVRGEPAGDAAEIGALPAPDETAGDTVAAARTLAAAPASLLAIEAALLAAGGPEAILNQDVTSANRARFATLVGGTRALLAAARPWQLSVAGLKLRQAGRIASLLLAAVIAVGLLRHCLAVDESFTVIASATFDAGRHGADKATDGDTSTEWLLPSRNAGWLEIRFAPRRLRVVRVRNAVNQPFKDRGTHDFRIECYRGGQLVHSSKHTFDKIQDNPPSMEFPTAVENVDALRIVVDSYHQSGAGLSEVAWK